MMKNMMKKMMKTIMNKIIQYYTLKNMFKYLTSLNFCLGLFSIIIAYYLKTSGLSGFLLEVVQFPGNYVFREAREWSLSAILALI
jgi:hypothetical protein